MKKGWVAAGLSLALVGVMGFAAVASSSLPAAKATARVFNFNVLDAAAATGESGSSGWQPIMTTQMKTANQKDLFVDVSLQSSLYTMTHTRSKDMVWDTSNAIAGLQVRVLIDGVPAQPGTITFDARQQELSSRLQGEVDLVDRDGDGVIEPGELESVDYEEIKLLLSTIGAHSFNFIAPDVASGIHTITVEAKVDVEATAQNGSAEAKAVVGAGSVTVQQVRMVRGELIEITE